MAVYIQIDSLFDIDIQTLAEQVTCIDGHGCANQAMYAGGRNSSTGGGTRSEMKMLRFDDQAAITNNGNLASNRRHHCSTSDGYNCYIYGGRGSGGYRNTIEKQQFTVPITIATIFNNTLSSARTGTMGTGTATSQVFFGGRETGSYPFPVHSSVSSIRNDDSVAATTMQSMIKPRWHHSVAGDGETALITQGWDNDADNGVDLAGAASDTYERYRLDYGSGYTVSSVERSHMLLPARNDVNSASGGDCAVLVGGEEPDYTGVYGEIKNIRYNDNVVTIMSQALPTATKELQCCGNGDVVMAAGGFTFTNVTGNGDAETSIYLVRVDDSASIVTQTNSLDEGRSEGSCSSGF